MHILNKITSAKVDASILAFYIPFISVGSTLARIASRNKRIILNFMEETWKHIHWYDFLYKISSYWKLLKIIKKNWKLYEVPVKIHTQTSWYNQVRLRVWKIWKYKLLHRLVAESFIKNPNNYPEVNHKDSIKSNNKAENLEWVTRKQNQKHASLYWKMWTEISQYTKEWEYIKTWKSLSIAGNELWILSPAICQALKWKSRTSWWFIWKYAKNV